MRNCQKAMFANTPSKQAREKMYVSRFAARGLMSHSDDTRLEFCYFEVIGEAVVMLQ
jgi:hypothetical protein